MTDTYYIIYLFVYLFICLFIYLCMYLFIVYSHLSAPVLWMIFAMILPPLPEVERAFDLWRGWIHTMYPRGWRLT
jgi:hypothetical protein